MKKKVIIGAIFSVVLLASIGGIVGGVLSHTNNYVVNKTSSLNDKSYQNHETKEKDAKTTTDVIKNDKNSDKKPIRKIDVSDTEDTSILKGMTKALTNFTNPKPAYSLIYIDMLAHIKDTSSLVSFQDFRKLSIEDMEAKLLSLKPFLDTKYENYREKFKLVKKLKFSEPSKRNGGWKFLRSLWIRYGGNVFDFQDNPSWNNLGILNDQYFQGIYYGKDGSLVANFSNALIALLYIQLSSDVVDKTKIISFNDYVKLKNEVMIKKFDNLKNVLGKEYDKYVPKIEEIAYGSSNGNDFIKEMWARFGENLQEQETHLSGMRDIYIVVGDLKGGKDGNVFKSLKEATSTLIYIEYKKHLSQNNELLSNEDFAKASKLVKSQELLKLQKLLSKEDSDRFNTLVLGIVKGDVFEGKVLQPLWEHNKKILASLASNFLISYNFLRMQLNEIEGFKSIFKNIPDIARIILYAREFKLEHAYINEFHTSKNLPSIKKFVEGDYQKRMEIFLYLNKNRRVVKDKIRFLNDVLDFSKHPNKAIRFAIEQWPSLKDLFLQTKIDLPDKYNKIANYLDKKT